MKKRVLSLFLALCMVSSLLVAIPQTAFAATSGIYTYTVSNGQATITKCQQSASGAITIPETLGGYPVTSIGERAFYRCYRLTNIEIPDSVTSIGNYAFYYCESLISIEIPDSVTSIGDYTFRYCETITE